MNDQTIQRDILGALAFEPRIDAAHIGVTVDTGVATLTGHENSYAE